MTSSRLSALGRDEDGEVRSIRTGISVVMGRRAHPRPELARGGDDVVRSMTRVRRPVIDNSSEGIKCLSGDEEELKSTNAAEVGRRLSGSRGAEDLLHRDIVSMIGG